MPPYQQKTDSREFEVANAGQYPSALSGEARTGGSEIALRLWTANQNMPRSWKADSVLVYMIADLVAASGGQIAEAEQAVMAAKFESPGQALVAAKRIQTSIFEFVACRPSERIGAAILIYQPRSSDSSGLSGELARIALEKARPGQILLAENISQRLRDLPGVEFRAIEGLTGDGPTGLTELMWTTAERFAVMRDAVGTDAGQAAAPKTADSGSSERRSNERPNQHPEVGATSIVQSPFARPGTPAQAARPDRGQAAAKRADQISNSTRERGPGFEGFKESPGASFGEGLDEFAEPPLFTRARILLGAAALVLVTVVILVLFRPTKVSKPPLPLQPEQSIGTDSSDKQPATTAPAASQPPVTTEQPGLGAGTPPQVKPPVARRATKNLADAREGKSEEPPALEEYGGYFQKDIPYLLDMARTDAGKGDYVKAQKEYSTVLKLQPKNQEAKDGQHKIALSLASPQ
jgi:hypothetical protein